MLACQTSNRHGIPTTLCCTLADAPDLELLDSAAGKGCQQHVVAATKFAQQLDTACVWMTMCSAQHKPEPCGSCPCCCAGGQIAAYHRLTKPDVFASAVAASAPVSYVVNTKMWAATSNNYYTITAASADRNSGHGCAKVIRSGIVKVGDLIQTAGGRQQLQKTFNFCPGTGLPSYEAGVEFQASLVGDLPGYAMSNNQPPYLGKIAEFCSVLLDAVGAGKDEVQALAAMTTYMQRNDQQDWCLAGSYDSAAKADTSPGDVATNSVSVDDAYGYQCCTQGAVHGGLLPSLFTQDSFTPAGNVSFNAFLEDCKSDFGASLPAFRPPAVASHAARMVLEVGSIVFTNGELDPWAGGSWTALNDIRATLAAGGGAFLPADGQTEQFIQSIEVEGLQTGRSPHSLAFVVYSNASHCTDTHTYTWDQPGQPPVWKQQRAKAMNYAVRFANQHRAKVLG